MPSPFPAACLAGLALLLAGCGDFPEVDAAATERLTAPSARPRITPIDAIRDEADTVTISDADTAAITDRATTLRSRAAGLEALAADPATVERLTTAIPAP